MRGPPVEWDDVPEVDVPEVDIDALHAAALA